MTNELLATVLDMLGTFVFALSGAIAARERSLDLFGLIIVAFLTACGGGILRDVCLGVIPPTGLSSWPYLALTVLATGVSILFYRALLKLSYPVLLFDALGLAIFAVAGTKKAIALGQNYQVAILLGVLSAIGGGVIRDLLLGKIPVVLRKEVYGSAALLGAMTIVLADYMSLDPNLGALISVCICFSVRYFSIKRKWKLPTFEQSPM